MIQAVRLVPIPDGLLEEPIKNSIFVPKTIWCDEKDQLDRQHEETKPKRNPANATTFTIIY